MNTESQDTNDELANFQRLVTKVIIGIALFFVLIVTVHIYNFFITGKADQEAFAQFGDYIGGLLNPVLGFSTVLLLIYSIRIQGQELRNTTEELKLTREEMKIANEEARRSADAALQQAVHLRARDRIDEVSQTLNIHDSAIDNIFSQPLPVPRSYYKQFAHSSLTFNISVNDIISNPDVNAENLKKGYEENRHLGTKMAIVSIYLSISEHIGDEHAEAIMKRVIIQSRNKLKAIFECICELIELGMSNIRCQQLLNNYTELLMNLERIGVNSDMFRYSQLKLVDGATSKRQQVDPSFKLIIQEPF